MTWWFFLGIQWFYQSVLLNQYAFVSGYKVKEEKSMFIGINIDLQVKRHLANSNKEKWAEHGVKYLGIIISKHNKDLVSDHLFPLITSILNFQQ